MEFIIGLVVIGIILWVISTKKQANAIRAFSAADLSRNWFSANGLDFDEAGYSSYPSENTTTLVGVTKNTQGDLKGFIVEVNHISGEVSGGMVIRPVDAGQNKIVAAYSKQTGLSMLQIYRSRLKNT